MNKALLIGLAPFMFTAALCAQEVISTKNYSAPKTAQIPVFDGAGTDACWASAQWYAIDKIWLPYNNNLDYPGVNTKEATNKLIDADAASDFTGKFKMVWNDNLLFFLVETNDNVFSDGWSYMAGGYPSFDVLEIFIDEDKSGGLHVFDPGGVTGLGTNAENAFSYHMMIDQPTDGNSISALKAVVDIKGNSWSNNLIDYAAHFKNFTVKRSGTKLIWEFAIGVYDDTYVHASAEDARVTLTEDKQIGLAIAYCDEDDKPSNGRDHFFGSVPLSAAQNNDGWKDASVYGTVTLTGLPETEAPSVPSELAVTGKSATSVSLSWTASTDNVEVVGYEVYNGETLVETVTGTTYTVSDLSPSTAYSFTVKAKDAAGNKSAASEAVNATTDAPVGLQQITSGLPIRLWPVPVTDMATVSFENALNGDVTLEVYDMSGRKLMEKSYRKSAQVFEQSFSTANLSKGIYVLVVKTAYTQQSIRFIR